jgi:hypothetical protein
MSLRKKYTLLVFGDSIKKARTRLASHPGNIQFKQKKHHELSDVCVPQKARQSRD